MLALKETNFLSIMNTMADYRLDKWLWAVRLYKTRAVATDACRGGFVKGEGRALKPAYAPKIGDIFTVKTAGVVRTVRVRALLDKRVGAKHVGDYMEDLTAPEVFEAARADARELLPKRPRGSGRPTKKERRDLDQFFDG